VRTLDLRTSWAPRRNTKGLCAIFQGTSVTLHTILLGVGGTIYNNLQQSHAEALLWASKLHVHSGNYAAKLVHTRRALFSTIINSHQETVSGQVCSPPDPHWSLYFLVKGITVPDTEMASYPWLLWGVVFHCLLSFFFFIQRTETLNCQPTNSGNLET